MMDFSQHAGKESKSALVPGGVLAFVHINVRETKLGKAPSTSRYMDCELTIIGPHPFADRKIFTKIADPMHEGNSADYKTMGQNAICRILEVNGASPSNPAGYHLPRIEDIHNKRGAIRVRVEEGDAGYQDKNEVGEWLTPNPTSKSGNKGWADLIAGNVLPKALQGQQQAAAGIQPSMFPTTAPAAAQATVAAQPAAQPSWQPGAPAANPQQPQQEAPATAAAPAWSTSGASSPSVQTTPVQTPSPSNPAQPPAPTWLQQTQPR